MVNDNNANSQPEETLAGEESGAGPNRNGRRRGGRLLFRWFGFLLIFLAFALTLYGAVAYVAWQQGQAQRMERAVVERQAQITQQMSLAREDLANGNAQLAMRRLEWVLEQEPDYPGARTLYAQAQTARGQEGAPTPAPVQTPTPSPTREDAPLEQESAEPDVELARIERLMGDEQWLPAIEALQTFQRDYPNHERRRTDEMLYQAQINHGLRLLMGDQVELGLFYLSQAERLGDLPEEALDYRAWADLYLLGIAFYGVDWRAATFYFRDLCLAAPFYQNACDWLHRSLVHYGDLYAVQEDWCPAQELYAEANRRQSSVLLREKLDQAREGCLAATPTPTVTLEGFEAIEEEETGDGVEEAENEAEADEDG